MESNKKQTGIRSRLIAAAFYSGKILSWIYGLKISLFFTDGFNSCYSGWLSRNFNHCGKGLRVSYPLHYSGLKYISVGENFTAGPRLRIEAHDRYLNDTYNPILLIGDNVNINFDCHIGCIHQVYIGNGVLIAGKVLIIDHLHGETSLAGLKLSPAERPLTSKGPVRIGDNVLIGEGCVILPGVTIGENCIIGGNSVVTTSFEANTVIGGNPARAIKKLE